MDKNYTDTSKFSQFFDYTTSLDRYTGFRIVYYYVYIQFRYEVSFVTLECVGNTLNQYISVYI